MNELKTWTYNNSEVRTVEKDGEPWWVLADVCKVLELSNPTKVAARLDVDEKANFELGLRGGTTNCINESGLYSVILRSDKPQAKPFRKWVTSEVLPIIRRTGGYVSSDDTFIETYFPFADDNTKMMFKNTLETVRRQNEVIRSQRNEITHKENVIIGLVDGITVADKRQILNRVVRYKCSDYRKRWQMLYREFENKFHMDISRRIDTYNKDHKPKCRNKIDYIDRVLNKIPELYELAVKLFENDVKELVNEMYGVNSNAGRC